MATIKLQGNSIGSGSITLTAPDTNSTRTITLPDEDVDLGSIGGAGSIKAWVNYSHTSNVIRDSNQVSSVTDTATGIFTVNWTSAFSNTYYITSVMAGGDNVSTNVPAVGYTFGGGGAATTTLLRSFNAEDVDGGFVDYVNQDVIAVH
jgi:hypothetical protein